MNILELLKKTKRKLLALSEDVRVYLARTGMIPANKDFTKFIILARSRTGSNMLCSYLEAHPHIYMRKEILAKREGKSIDLFLNRFFSVQPQKFEASGFKIFYYHPLDDDSGEIWEALREIKGLKIIHLKRKNMFEMHVSWKKATVTDAWVAGKDSPQLNSIEIDPIECEKSFRKTINWQEQTMNKLPEHQVLDIFYEDLVKYTSEQLDIIQHFLNVPVHNLGSITKKQQKRPVQSIVSNYDELEEYFSDTPWHFFFNRDESAAG